MSMPFELTITCPGCGAEGRFVAWGSLNVTLNPERKQELVSGELTRFVCPNCGQSGQVVYPLLYHDMAKHLMIWLVPSGDELPPGDLPFGEMMRDYDLRLVATLNELVEKILIFDAGLDDRIVECFKLVIQNSTLEGDRPFAGLLWFVEVARSEGGQEVIRFELQKPDSGHLLEVPIESFNQIRALIEAQLPAAEPGAGKWLRVNAEYAHRYLDSEGD